ncbi:hypothetical protein AWB71_05544 [Caballeronia peredens]|nr:hypothetical protein AWB71_05544 [Caballeronia peredens]
MKVSKLATILVTTSIAISAFSQTARAQEKSRAQVQQELADAHHEGTIPTNKTQYPPNDEQKARNRAAHATAQHQGEKAPDLDQHDQFAKAK